MYDIIYLFFSFILTYFFISLSIKNNFFSNLIDYPSKRKKHLNNVPAIGGIVFFSIICFFLIIINILDPSIIQIPNFNIVFFCSLAFFLLGLIDDIFRINVFLKLFSQIVICLFSITMIDFIGQFSWPFLLNLGLNDYSVFVSFVFMLIVINGINFLDGIDGLLCILTIFMLSSFLILFEMNFIILFMIFIGSLLAFLIFNKPPAKVFFGDSGSLLIGFILVILFFNYFSIYAVSKNFFSPFIILALPIIDFIYVVFIRFTAPGNIKKRFFSIFLADRKHIHYKILSLTNSSVKTLFYMSFYNFIILIYLLFENNG